MDSNQQEEICIHVVPQHSETEDDQHIDFNFDIIPFRETFFRYSIHGKSEVVRSSSIVYASHHSSQSAWLDIKKISIALVGSNVIPNLAFFSPTVKEVYFMGQITYPTTAFGMLPQLGCLEKVSFNIGLGGYSRQFEETADEFLSATPEIPSVTSLDIKVNHQVYRGCTKEVRSIFDRVIESVIKHSSDSFPNLQDVSIELPESGLFFESVVSLLNSNANLRDAYEVKISKNDRKIQVYKKIDPEPACLEFDPCARFPTNSEFNIFRML